MAWSCGVCGAHGDGTVRDGQWICAGCGSGRSASVRPLRIVTGAAATGKSTLAVRLAEQPGVVAIDTDVMSTGAAAVHGQRDYVAFWSYLMRVGFEIHQSGVDVIWCGICRPEQLAAQPDDLRARFSRIELLLLSVDPADYERRLLGRPRGERAVANGRLHVSLNDELRAARSSSGIRITHLDTTRMPVDETVRAAVDWVESTASANPRPSRET